MSWLSSRKENKTAGHFMVLEATTHNKEKEYNALAYDHDRPPSIVVQ